MAIVGWPKCPILCIGLEEIKDQDKAGRCLEDACMWFNKEESQCLIKDIVGSLKKQ